MTREEAKKLLLIIQAYLDGKPIEYFIDGKWIELKDPEFKGDVCKYRIKSEPTHRPFKNGYECHEEMKKHEPFGWLKSKSGDCRVINSVNFANINSNNYYYNYKQAFDDFTFLDGTPFGIKE